jgi:AcrR family transcriptional regulator
VVRDFQRARQPEQKEERRAHLLATARAMLEGGVDLGALSLSELARQAGMAKSNVYRYFETREALLLALLWEEWLAWYERMVATYKPAARRDAAFVALVRHLAQTLAARPLLCALITATPSVLERNLGEEATRDFKTRSVEALRQMGRSLAALVPDLSAEEYAALLYDSIAVIGGLYPTAYPAAYAARVVAEPPFALLRRDLARDVERFLLALARDRVRQREHGIA